MTLGADKHYRAGQGTSWDRWPDFRHMEPEHWDIQGLLEMQKDTNYFQG